MRLASGPTEDFDGLAYLVNQEPQLPWRSQALLGGPADQICTSAGGRCKIGIFMPSLFNSGKCANFARGKKLVAIDTAE